MSTDPATSLAQRARRLGLSAVIWNQRERLTLERLDVLLSSDKYGPVLAELTVDDIRAWDTELDPLRLRALESNEEAIIRVFRSCSEEWLTSGFFARNMGLARWTAQAELARLAEHGLLERKGKTSGTCYRLADHLRIGAC